MSKRFRGYALIVTVEQNEHYRLADLGQSVIADGDLIESILLNEDVCGYSSKRVSRLSGRNATAENILSALDALSTTVGTEDPVFLYFSGHGDASSCDGSDGASLYPWNAEIDRCEHVLTSGLLARAWGSIPSSRKLAVVDACYSGGLRMTKLAKASEKLLVRHQLNALAEGEGSVVISSSRAAEPSLILAQDPTSLFTKYLANGLLGQGGHDAEGFVRVFDLFNYVAMKVRSEAPAQTPVYASYHQDHNFAVAYCADRHRRKTRTPLPATAFADGRLQTATTLFSLLYPLGPTDQAIWERSGGDLSRLTLNGAGRSQWFRAIRYVIHGGASLTIEMLCREALYDYPRNRDLERLLDSL